MEPLIATFSLALRCVKLLRHTLQVGYDGNLLTQCSSGTDNSFILKLVQGFLAIPLANPLRIKL